MDVHINTWLAGHGFSTDLLKLEARSVLERSGLTRPHKSNIDSRKLQHAEASLSDAFIRSCHQPDCQTEAVASGLRFVAVRRDLCDLCGGTSFASDALLALLINHGIHKVVVVGGSPSVHRRLREAFASTPVRLCLVDGTRDISAPTARAMRRDADLLVVWASTMLRHSVSAHFTGQHQDATVITVSRRGLSAFSQALIGHL